MQMAGPDQLRFSGYVPPDGSLHTTVLRAFGLDQDRSQRMLLFRDGLRERNIRPEAIFATFELHLNDYDACAPDCRRDRLALLLSSQVFKISDDFLDLILCQPRIRHGLMRANAPVVGRQQLTPVCFGQRGSAREFGKAWCRKT